jgi:hypothetical protein
MVKTNLGDFIFSFLKKILKNGKQMAKVLETIKLSKTLMRII